MNHGDARHGRGGEQGTYSGRTMLVVYQKGKKKYALGATMASSGNGVSGGGDDKGCGGCSCA